MLPASINKKPLTPSTPAPEVYAQYLNGKLFDLTSNSLESIENMTGEEFNKYFSTIATIKSQIQTAESLTDEKKKYWNTLVSMRAFFISYRAIPASGQVDIFRVHTLVELLHLAHLPQLANIQTLIIDLKVETISPAYLTTQNSLLKALFEKIRTVQNNDPNIAKLVSFFSSSTTFTTSRQDIATTTTSTTDTTVTTTSSSSTFASVTAQMTATTITPNSSLTATAAPSEICDTQSPEYILENMRTHIEKLNALNHTSRPADYQLPLQPIFKTLFQQVIQFANTTTPIPNQAVANQRLAHFVQQWLKPLGYYSFHIAEKKLIAFYSEIIQILKTWGQKQDTPLAPTTFEMTLTQIYQHIGEHYKNASASSTLRSSQPSFENELIIILRQLHNEANENISRILCSIYKININRIVRTILLESVEVPVWAAVSYRFLEKIENIHYLPNNLAALKGEIQDVMRQIIPKANCSGLQAICDAIDKPYSPLLYQQPPIPSEWRKLYDAPPAVTCTSMTTSVSTASVSTASENPSIADPTDDSATDNTPATDSLIRFGK